MTRTGRLLIAAAVPTLTLAGLGYAYLQPGAGAGAQSISSVSTGSAWSPRSRAAAEVPVEDLGTVQGVVTLGGPAQVPARASVRFALDGPDRWSRTDRRAPFRARLDSRWLDDGTYTLTVSTVLDGTASVSRRGTLRVANRPGATPPSYTAPPVTTPPSSTAAPTTSAPPAPPTTTAPPAPPTTSSPPPATAPPTTTAPPVTTPPVTTTAPPATDPFVTQVVTLTNAERANNGCAALKVNAILTTVAQAHSADMARNDYFSHTSLDGRSPFQRMTDAGYRYSGAAENIAAGQRTPQDVVTAWMNSAGHRANILNCSLTEIGVGYATGGSYGQYWTQDFGRPR